MMVCNSVMSLRGALTAIPVSPEAKLSSIKVSVRLDDVARGSYLSDNLFEFAERSVLIAARDQLVAALAMIELDGLVRRMTVCPRDLEADQLSYVFEKADADAVVSDLPRPPGFAGKWIRLSCQPNLIVNGHKELDRISTEWVLLTSGTTGVPKLVEHSLASLTAAVRSTNATDRICWGTYYDICRYGGLQILLRAILGKSSLVLSDVDETLADYLDRLADHGATHVLGTPTHWRRVLMTTSARRLAPKYVRLSGEISHQSILNALAEFYRGAVVAHAFASTEAGVAFAVNDGLSGFPAALVTATDQGVELDVESGSLRIRSRGNATRYIDTALPLKDSAGFVDTGDLVERRQGRYYFLGRKSGVINVGGLKVHPEEVEAVINAHPRVQASLVRARRSSIVGSLVTAEVVLNHSASGGEELSLLKAEILERCRASLSKHKVPTSVNIVPSLAVGPTGKLLRGDG